MTSRRAGVGTGFGSDAMGAAAFWAAVSNGWSFVGSDARMIYPIARKEPTWLLADRESGLQVIGEIGRSR